MSFVGSSVSRLTPGARAGVYGIGLVAALFAALVAVRIPGIGPATIGVEIAFFATRVLDPFWAKVVSKFLRPFAVAMPAIVILQYLQNHGFLSASLTVAIESECRDANTFLKDVLDISFLRATGLLLVAILLELLTPRWKAVSAYVRATKALAFCSGVLAAFSCFTFTTAKVFEGDINGLKVTLQARLGSERDEHFNVKVRERELSAEQEVLRNDRSELLKLRAVGAAVHARVANASPGLEDDIVKDTEYAAVTVNVARSQVTKLLSGKAEDILFSSVPAGYEHPQPVDLAARTAAVVEGLAATHLQDSGGRRPPVDLVLDIDVLQKEEALERSSLEDEKKIEGQLKQAVEEESNGLFDTLTDPFKDRLKSLIETLCRIDTGVIRQTVGDLSGKLMDVGLDKAKEWMAKRATAALKSALAPFDTLVAHTFVTDEIRKAHEQYQEDLQAVAKETGTQYAQWEKKTLPDDVMDSDLRELRLAFLRDALTLPAVDDSIFDQAQVLRPMEDLLSGIEHAWAPRFKVARTAIEADRLSAKGDKKTRMEELEDQAKKDAAHPEADRI